MANTTAQSKYETKRGDYHIETLGREHMQSVKDLFIKTFCDYEPVTKHLGIKYSEYEPFVMAVLQKAVKDGLSVVAVDNNDSHHVVACTIAEDITDTFHPELKKYPKMEPIFALIETLSSPFFSKKTFKKGKISHTWIAMVDRNYQGKGLSTSIDLACTNLAASKGYDFTYAEFTNSISENISHHYTVSKKMNEIAYDKFTYKNTHPFEGVKGGAASYILGIKPGVTIETLGQCYTTK